MWGRGDCARVLLAAIIFLIVGLLLFPPPSSPATRRPVSPALYLWRHAHAPRGSLVGVHCRRLAGAAIECTLVVQPSVKRRSCWLVQLLPRGRGWLVLGFDAIAHDRCPILSGEHRGGRALKA